MRSRPGNKFILQLLTLLEATLASGLVYIAREAQNTIYKDEVGVVWYQGELEAKSQLWFE